MNPVQPLQLDWPMEIEKDDYSTLSLYDLSELIEQSYLEYLSLPLEDSETKIRIQKKYFEQTSIYNSRVGFSAFFTHVITPKPLIIITDDTTEQSDS